MSCPLDFYNDVLRAMSTEAKYNRMKRDQNG
jgi:hypothetical protein